MLGARTPGKLLDYIPDPVAAKHGVSVKERVDNSREAYADQDRTWTSVSAPVALNRDHVLDLVLVVDAAERGHGRPPALELPRPLDAAVDDQRGGAGCRRPAAPPCRARARRISERSRWPSR